MSQHLAEPDQAEAAVAWIDKKKEEGVALPWYHTAKLTPHSSGKFLVPGAKLVDEPVAKLLKDPLMKELLEAQGYIGPQGQQGAKPKGALTPQKRGRGAASGTEGQTPAAVGLSGQSSGKGTGPSTLAKTPSYAEGSELLRGLLDEAEKTSKKLEQLQQEHATLKEQYAALQQQHKELQQESEGPESYKAKYNMLRIAMKNVLVEADEVRRAPGSRAAQVMLLRVPFVGSYHNCRSVPARAVSGTATSKRWPPGTMISSSWPGAEPRLTLTCSSTWPVDSAIRGAADCWDGPAVPVATAESVPAVGSNSSCTCEPGVAPTGKVQAI